MLTRREALKQMFAGTIGILPAMKIMAGIPTPIRRLHPGSMAVIPVSSITCDPTKSFRADPYGNIGPLIDSIRELGLMNPIDVNPRGEVINGFRRFRALQELDVKDIPVRVFSEEDAKLVAVGVMSNRSTLVSSYGDEEDELDDDEVEEADDAIDDDDVDDDDDDDDDDWDDDDDDDDEEE